MCTETRSLVVNWKVPPGVQFRSIKVFLNGERIAKLPGSARSVPLSLKSTGPAVFRLLIDGRSTNGQAYQNRRDYRLCKPAVTFKPSGSLTLARPNK